MGRRADHQHRILGYLHAVLEDEGAFPDTGRMVSELGISRSTAYRYLDRAAADAGIPPPRLIARTTPEGRKALASHVAQGASVAMTARLFGVGENTVRRSLDAAGVSVRPRARKTPQPREQQSASQTPRGDHFLFRCRALAEAAASTSGIPASQRRLVLSMCLPALAARPQIRSSHLALAVPVAVEFNVCRTGRAATLHEIGEHFPSVSAQTLKEALKHSVSFGSVRMTPDGYIATGPDPMCVAASRLRGLPSEGWRQDLAEHRDALLSVLLGD